MIKYSCKRQKYLSIEKVTHYNFTIITEFNITMLLKNKSEYIKISYFDILTPDIPSRLVRTHRCSAEYI